MSSPMARALRPAAREPVEEGLLVLGVRGDVETVGHQEVAGREPLGGVGEVGRVGPGDEPRAPAGAGAEAHLEKRDRDELGDGDGHRSNVDRLSPSGVRRSYEQPRALLPIV